MNSFGRIFRVSVFGESHGPAIGVVLDGVPAHVPLSVEDLAKDLARRAPGAKGTTSRRENDVPEILSGVFEGYTTGVPITLVWHNADVRSEDYEDFLNSIPRPGHADYPAGCKFRGLDKRGGGHFSGRLTLALVAAGAVARKILKELKIEVSARLVEVGGEKDPKRWEALLDEVAAQGDSLGAVVECTAERMPVGLGEPFFDSVESLVSHAVFSIPGVRGIEFGDGFAAARMRGSEHNDPLIAARRFSEEKGEDVLTVAMAKNGAGGVNGGLSNGAPLHFRVAFKPTSSISRPQKTLNLRTWEEDTLVVKGRHDVCFALRTPVIVEAVTAMVLLDLSLLHGTADIASHQK